MKKVFFAISLMLILASCASTRDLVIPKAVNTINSVSLNELNLERDDYKILNTVVATAEIAYTESRAGEYVIRGENNEFMLQYVYNKKTGWSCRYSGIVKLGYLDNDYDINTGIIHPEDVARRLAIYRLINLVSMEGGDGVIEPVISTNIAQQGNNIIYKNTVKAKVVKLNTNI